ncbi:MAG TPA: DUF4163 domain-containing protein [Candidatus Pacearchaeota archaeon]|nr:DUF4163 domain-containing protein [Candidatus Pacearchaeota archaeon]
MNIVKYLLTILITSILLCSGFYFFTSNKDNTFVKAENEEIYRIEFEKETVLLSQSDLYTAEAKYPITPNDDINKSLNDVVSTEINDYIILVEETGATPAFSEDNRYPFIVDYTTYSYLDKIKSFVFDIYGFTGGAHGFSSTITKTYDLESGKAYSINDVITDLSKFTEIVRESIKNELSLRGEIVDEEWITMGTDSDSLEKFSLSENGLTMYFPPYQVASYASGTIICNIPFESMQDILSPEFVK